MNQLADGDASELRWADNRLYDLNRVAIIVGGDTAAIATVTEQMN